jgi:hypothetical protein
MSVQDFAEASQKFTVPNWTAAPPARTVAVRVTTDTAGTVVTVTPPEVTVSVVLVAAAAAQALETPARQAMRLRRRDKQKTKREESEEKRFMMKLPLCARRAIHGRRRAKNRSLRRKSNQRMRPSAERELKQTRGGKSHAVTESDGRGKWPAECG